MKTCFPNSFVIIAIISTLLTPVVSELHFKVITHDANEGLEGKAKESFTPYKDSLTVNAGDALFLLIQDDKIDDLSALKENFDFSDEEFSVEHITDPSIEKLNTFVIFRNEAKDKLKNIEIVKDKVIAFEKEEDNEGGVLFVKMTIDNHLYLIANVNLNKAKEKANDQLEQIYTYITLEKNKHLYGTDNPKEIEEKGGAAVDGKTFSTIMAGSFILTTSEEVLKGLDGKSPEENGEEILNAFKAKVNDGPLINWMKRDKEKQESFKSGENKHLQYAKTVFEEQRIDFEPTEAYTVSADAGVLSEDVALKFEDSNKMSYTNRIIYHVDEKVVFDNYHLIREMGISNSKPVLSDFKDSTEYETKEVAEEDNE